MAFNVDEVLESGMCTGCGLCAGLSRGSIIMKIDHEGFLRPKSIELLDARVRDELTNACPAITLRAKADSSAQIHPLWGPIISCSQGHATDPDTRFRASSGGVLSGLTEHLLNERLVDAVVQIRGSSVDIFENDVVLSLSRADVLSCSGSRYSPAAPLSKIGDLLTDEKTYAFVGKPCDVAALRQLLASKPELESKFPYLLSFMCAGTPSQHASYAILDHMQVDAKEVRTFRYRGEGWPGHAQATTITGNIYEMDYASSWGNILGKALQLRCKLCPDGVGEFADIVCGDAWDTPTGFPDFDEKDGVSLILARTDRGSSLLMSAVKAGRITQTPIPVETLRRIQPYQEARKRLVFYRLIGYALRRFRWPGFQGLRLARAAIRANPLTGLRQAVGTFRRAK